MGYLAWISTRRGRLIGASFSIAEACARLPVIDDRPAEEILGYDETGLPRY